MYFYGQIKKIYPYPKMSKITKTTTKRRQVRRDPVDEKLAKLALEATRIDDEQLEVLAKKNEILARKYKNIALQMQVQIDKKKRKDELKKEMESEIKTTENKA